MTYTDVDGRAFHCLRLRKRPGWFEQAGTILRVWLSRSCEITGTNHERRILPIRNTNSGSLNKTECPVVERQPCNARHTGQSTKFESRLSDLRRSHGLSLLLLVVTPIMLVTVSILTHYRGNAEKARAWPTQHASYPGCRHPFFDAGVAQWPRSGGKGSNKAFHHCSWSRISE